MKKATDVLYVTNEFLQRRYPTDGRQMGCSDVELQSDDESFCYTKLEGNAFRNKKMVLGTIGKIDLKYKGHSTVIDAVKKMRSLGYDVQYNIVGPGDKTNLENYARENNLPFLGLCLGMQCAVIEFARNVIGWTDANSSEMEPTKHAVIDLMEEQKNVTAKGGTMRLGGYPCQLAKNSNVAKAYETLSIVERHRHRYEFNSHYLADFEAAGMKAVGQNPDTGLVEVVEIPSHRWFVGTQYHPEYHSTAANPHPLFVAFVKEALKYRDENSK